MDNDIYAIPDPETEYESGISTNNNIIKAKKFTLLMKLVLLTKKHPELHDKIRKYLTNNLEEVKQSKTFSS